MSRIRIARNAALSMAQTVVSAGALVLTYWLLMRTLPIAEIGLWSLVIGTTLVARLSELGLGAGVLRFVAGDLGAGRPQVAAATVGMALAAVTVLVGALALALQPLLLVYLRGVTPPALSPAVMVLLPAALVGIVLTAAGGVLLGALDGCQRIDVRAYLQMVSSLVQLGATWLVLPHMGLTGLGLVQVVQAGSLALASLFAVLLVLRQPLRAYLRFDRTRLRAMLLYGGNLQLAAIAQVLFEPLIKVLLATYSGLTLTGYYDMANRIVLQFRALLAAAYGALVPHVANLDGAGGLEDERLRAIYHQAFGWLLLVVPSYFACIASGLPLALTVWKGQFDPVFLQVALLQCAAWLFNALSLPAYTLNIGTGWLRWNTAAHLVMGAAVLLLGPPLGALLGGSAVLALGAIALAAGSLLVPWAFHRRYRVQPGELVQSFTILEALLALAAFAGALAIALGLGGPDPSWPLLAGFPLLTIVAALVTGWHDPLGREAMARLNLVDRSRWGSGPTSSN